MELTITADQKVVARVSALDAAGLTTPILVDPSWEVSDGAVLALSPIDALSVELVATAAGTTTLTARSGDLSVSATVTVTVVVVVPGAPASLVISFDEPQAK